MAKERKYWNEELETMSLDDLRKLQEKRLQETVSRAYEKTKFYRQKFDDAGIKPSDINTLDDLQKLPLIHSSEDFRKAPIPDRLAVPFEEVKYLESSSGTTGVPMAILWSGKDWKNLMDAEARARWTLGTRPSDVVHVLTGFPCCQGGYQHLGAMVMALSAGRGVLDNQIKLGQMVGVSVLEYLPSLVLKYFERATEMGYDIKNGSIRLISALGEGWAEAYKRRVEADYNVTFRTLYGSVDAGLIGAQCESGDGLHTFLDLVITEIIDPETGEVLTPGQEGELVITLLWPDATPIIRYRTGDVTKILPYEPCSCGRTHPRISMVRGRAVQITKVKGKNILPIDVEEIIADIPELESDYQILVDKPGELEVLKVKMEYKPDVKDRKALKKRVEDAFKKNLSVESNVELVPMGTLGREKFKATRVIRTYDEN
jgi:phenylacetate-CoA ligase